MADKIAAIEFAKDAMSKGYSDDEIEKLMHEHGYAPFELLQFQSQRENLRKSNEIRRAKMKIAAGILVFIVGVASTIFTYWKAKGGGIYMVSWGAMAYGVYSVLKGVTDYGSAKE